MRYKHEFTKENFEELMTMPYGRMVKAAAILQLIEEEGVNGSEFFKRRDILDYCVSLSEI